MQDAAPPVSEKPKPAYVNAFVDGDQVALLSRVGDKLAVTRVPAEYITYALASEMTEDIERSLRSSSSVRGVRREGKYVRISWLGDSVRRDMCNGRKERDRDGNYVTMPSPLMSAGIQLFEGDVDPVRRYFTDSGADIQSPRRCFLDIEADSRCSFGDAIEGKARVLMWSITDIDSSECTAWGVLEEDTDAAEAVMLTALWKALEPYDQVLAWNLDGYDGPVITRRSDRARVSVDIRRWLWLDAMSLFKKMNQHGAESGDEKQSMALQNVGMMLLGVGKEETPPEVIEAFGNKSMGALSWDLWAAGGKWRELLRIYMLRDTMMLKLIEDKTGYAVLFDTVCKVCHIFPNSRSLNNTEQVDGLLLRLGLERDHHFATKVYRDVVEQFPGAYVMQPKCKGIVRDVHVCDFAALYPSIIVTWNMSPETKVKNAPINGPIIEGTCRSPSTGIVFRTDVEGILVVAIKLMLHLRKYWNDLKATLTPGTEEWKEADRLSQAYKVAVNAFYGVISSPYSRFYDREIGESITQNGKWLLLLTMGEAENRGMAALYGDTDSAFIAGVPKTEFEAFVNWCNKDLYPTKLAALGCKDNLIKLAYEKQFDRLVMTGAKRYAANYVHYKGKAGLPVPRPGETFDKKQHSKPEIKGLEFKRGDTALLARRLQEHMIMQVLAGDEQRVNYEATLDTSLRHILEGSLPIEEVRMSKSLTKPLREYVTRVKKDNSAGAELAHVQVAKILKERGREITSGTRIEYIISDGAAAPNEVLPAEDYDGLNADRFYLWETLVWPPVQRFLVAAFPDWDWKRWDKVRPPKPRTPPKSARPLPGQVALVLDPEEPFVFAIDETWYGLLGYAAEVFKRYPGKRPLKVHVRLNDGTSAWLASRAIFVSGTEEMVSELFAMLGDYGAALDMWAEQISLTG